MTARQRYGTENTIRLSVWLSRAFQVELPPFINFCDIFRPGILKIHPFVYYGSHNKKQTHDFVGKSLHFLNIPITFKWNQYVNSKIEQVNKSGFFEPGCIKTHYTKTCYIHTDFFLVCLIRWLWNPRCIGLRDSDLGPKMSQIGQILNIFISDFNRPIQFRLADLKKSQICPFWCHFWA